MACIGSPNSCMDGDGVVRLSKIKSTKVNEICKKIEALIYTEAMFIQDMLAQWTDSQSSYIPSNIQKGKTVTQVFFNIDWKNKNVQRTETHHANLILVQKCDTKEDVTKIYSEPKYEFDRKKTPVLQSKHQNLPSVNSKRAEPFITLPFKS